MFMQSLHWSAKYLLKPTPHMSSQHNKDMTTSTLTFVFYQIVIIFKLHMVVSWWVDIHVGLMFIVISLGMNELGGAYYREDIIH